ncbi:cytochrome aa3 quinol oxidase subunit IV [Bacillus testis]|uniref:cytochrome aa3 quinol oxidase subunit IV n=1 Tax=Bacillus testis TaxID=1622072 RepID=UPI00067F6906|nr:cytochrome aa3 quinol oxidase subunit IV [Bacillus testis]
MSKLFPVAHIMGFLASIVLTLVAMCVYWFDLSFGASMSILFTTAILQAGVQVFLFMHIGESEDKSSIFLNLAFGIFVAVATIAGSLFTLVWGW